MAYTSWSVVANEQPSTAKWNILGTNDAFFATFLDSSAGTAWTTYTPTLTNVTLGSGSTNQGYYKQIGKTVFVRFNLVLGTGGSFSGSPTLTFPVTSSSNYSTGRNILNSCYMEDNAVNAYTGILVWSSTTVFYPNLVTTNATYAQSSSITATVPFTWGVGDLITGQFEYEAA